MPHYTCITENRESLHLTQHEERGPEEAVRRHILRGHTVMGMGHSTRSWTVHCNAQFAREPGCGISSRNTFMKGSLTALPWLSCGRSGSAQSNLRTGPTEPRGRGFTLIELLVV